jgi:hypothetical protein
MAQPLSRKLAFGAGDGTRTRDVLLGRHGFDFGPKRLDANLTVTHLRSEAGARQICNWRQYSTTGANRR